MQNKICVSVSGHSAPQSAYQSSIELQQQTESLVAMNLPLAIKVHLSKLLLQECHYTHRQCAITLVWSVGWLVVVFLYFFQTHTHTHRLIHANFSLCSPGQTIVLRQPKRRNKKTMWENVYMYFYFIAVAVHTLPASNGDNNAVKTVTVAWIHHSLSQHYSFLVFALESTM